MAAHFEQATYCIFAYDIDEISGNGNDHPGEGSVDVIHKADICDPCTASDARAVFDVGIDGFAHLCAE